ncbi:MAG TPA: helix-turn-helix domain-containing protein, partial [Desulfuromonadaceae bacterium]
IELPPLRKRAESVPELARHFLDKARKRLNKTIAGIEDRAVKAMQYYPWPGNIREMQNVIERSAVLVKDGVIRLENLPTIFTVTYDSCLDDVNRHRVSFKAERELQVVRTEKNIIVRYLEETDGNVAKAARLANLPRRTLYRLLEKHGIEVVRRSK